MELLPRSMAAILIFAHIVNRAGMTLPRQGLEFGRANVVYPAPLRDLTAVPTTIVDRATPVLKEHIRALFRQLPRALAGDEDAIHQMRVAGRRLRVALPLLARKPQGRRVKRGRRIMRALTRSAGTSRDLDVGVGLFEERLRGRGEMDPERRLLRQRLRAARGRSRVRLAEALMDIGIARLRR